MKTSVFLWLALLIVFANIPSVAQVNKTTNLLRDKLKSGNRQLTDAFLSGNSSELIKFYTSDAVCMPEYQPMMKGTDAIRK